MNYLNYLIMSLRVHYFVIASAAKQSKTRLVSCAGVSCAGLRPSAALAMTGSRNDVILEFIKYFLNRDLGICKKLKRTSKDEQ